MKEWLIEYWGETAFGAIVAFIGFSYKKNAKKKEQERIENLALKMGMKALLRDRILQSYNHYMDLGFCPIYARENISDMYEQYHNLGGNGTVTKLVEKLFELPTERDDSHKKEN